MGYPSPHTCARQPSLPSWEAHVSSDCLRGLLSLLLLFWRSRKQVHVTPKGPRSPQVSASPASVHLILQCFGFPEFFRCHLAAGFHLSDDVHHAFLNVASTGMRAVGKVSSLRLIYIMEGSNEISASEHQGKRHCELTRLVRAHNESLAR